MLNALEKQYALCQTSHAVEDWHLNSGMLSPVRPNQFNFVRNVSAPLDGFAIFDPINFHIKLKQYIWRLVAGHRFSQCSGASHHCTVSSSTAVLEVKNSAILLSS